MIELLWNTVGQYPKMLNVYIPCDPEISYTHIFKRKEYIPTKDILRMF